MMPLYMCDGCWEAIPALKARIHCLECEDFDLCANCFVVGRFGKGHLKKHKTSMEERSGIDVGDEAEPENPTLRAAPAIQSSWQSNPTSPPYSSTQSPRSSQGRAPVQSPAQSSHHNTPARTPIVFPTTVAQNSYTQLQFSPTQTEITSGWQPLFHGIQPTQTMLDLMTAIFLCLDTTGIRLLAPEQYSKFLDVQGYLTEENVWKRNAKSQYGYNPEDIADFELRTAYENFAIDHVLQPRVRSMNNSVPFNPTLSPVSNGQMPMLSLRGFIDITTVEVLGEPTAGWQRLNIAKTYYGVWMDWGDIPRYVVPDTPPQEILDRIAQISIFAQRKVAERIEANRIATTQNGWDSRAFLDRS